MFGCSWWCLVVPGGVWLLTMIAVTDELVAADFGGVWLLMMAVSC